MVNYVNKLLVYAVESAMVNEFDSSELSRQFAAAISHFEASVGYTGI